MIDLIEIGLLCAALWYCFSTNKIIKEAMEDEPKEPEQ